MYMQIEDEFGDVVGKARRGQELSLAQLADSTGVSEGDLERIEAYELTPGDDVVTGLAAALGLDAAKLATSAARRYFPLYPAGRPVPGLSVEMMVLGSDFLANGYVVGCTETGKGVIVDPGFQAEKILKTVGASGVDVEVVLLTHGHGDHAGALSEVCQATGAPALIGQADVDLLGELRTKIEGTLSEGQEIAFGNQVLRARTTPGHTPGSVSLIHPQAAFTGDALFAGSLGGTRRRHDYDLQRSAVAEKVLSLDDRTILYAGHGPATTVAEEKANNPFFGADLQG
ncbi:MBL fold metallo-hydrolase [Candidatus Latescibacterota bacterium]